MFTKLLLLIFSTFILLGFSSMAISSEPEGIIYGRDLMTKQEIAEHRTKIHSMKTAKEREAYRTQHHEKMRKRAKEMGVDISNEPMPRGSGMKPRDKSGVGRGSGMGSSRPRGM